MHAYVLSHSAQSLSLVQLLQSHGLYPARLHCSWDQKYWSGLPFPPPGYLPNLGIKPVSPMSSVLHGNSFSTEPPVKPFSSFTCNFTTIQRSPLVFQNTRDLYYNPITQSHICPTGQIYNCPGIQNKRKY